MCDPTGLEARLQAALGGESSVDPDGGRRGAGLDAARTRVLAGLRGRRTRRLQVLAAAAVVVLGLAVSLPQVLGSASPSTQATGVHARSAASAPAFAPATPRSGLAGSAYAAGRLVATCHVKGSEKTAANCGVLVTGSAARALTAAATSTQRSRAFGSSQSSKRLGRALVARTGAQLVVELPRVKANWRWSTPAIAGTPVYHGRGVPVTVRATGLRGATQEFLVTTKVPVTVVLEARDDVFSGPGAPPSIVDTEPAAAWTLELKVK